MGSQRRSESLLRDLEKAKRYKELECIIGFNSTKLKNTPEYQYPKVLYRGYMKYYKPLMIVGFCCIGMGQLFSLGIDSMAKTAINLSKDPSLMIPFIGLWILNALFTILPGILMLTLGRSHCKKKQTAINKPLYDYDYTRNAEERAMYKEALQAAVEEANAINFEGQYTYTDGKDLENQIYKKLAVLKLTNKNPYSGTNTSSSTKSNAKSNVVAFPKAEMKKMIYQNNIYVSMPFNQHPDGDIYVQYRNNRVAVIKKPDGSILPYASDEYDGVDDSYERNLQEIEDEEREEEERRRSEEEDAEYWKQQEEWREQKKRDWYEEREREQEESTRRVHSDEWDTLFDDWGHVFH